MPPRRQSVRQTHAVTAQYDPEVIAKRTKRHLDELERSNYSEPSGLLGFIQDEDEDKAAGRSAKSRARQTISDKRIQEGAKKKKSSMNVRTAVLYKKTFSQLLDESGISGLPTDTPSYLTAISPPSREPPRMLCSVCGYLGKYRCRRCGMAYCDRNCEATHEETRCERRVV
ncbi:unnamed protein product [Somion occarium]|uniref:HIT-type domain-containing protein n=1 Tax=Somion occarium TaxID=3059160 RepID=A0ABP1EC77_9APHY